MEATIRKALPEDAYEYAACHISSWRSAYKNIVPDKYLNSLSVEQRAEKFKQNMQKLKEYGYYCMLCKNKIIGILIIGKSRDEDKNNSGEICAIYLTEEFWGKGYGRQMMDFAVNAFKKDGYEEIVLWVLEENDRARRFYEGCHFVFDGIKKEITIGKPLVEVRYALSLLD